jgi:hypothetical protein
MVSGASRVKDGRRYCSNPSARAKAFMARNRLAAGACHGASSVCTPFQNSGKGFWNALGRDFVRTSVVGQVDGYTPPSFFQFVDAEDSPLFFSIRGVAGSKLWPYVNIHAGEIMPDRSREIQPIPSHIQRWANLLGVLRFDGANAERLRLVYQ